MHFTQSQFTEIIENIINKEDGLNIILKTTLEAMMKAERTEYQKSTQDYSNGYRYRKAFGEGKMIELKVPRTREGFYPVVLGLLKDQEKEAHNLAFELYKSGLTTDQVGNIFGELYGKHYSTSQVSRMFNDARGEIELWLKRPLNDYYPIIYIDAAFIPTRRVDSVSKEAYYTVLGVRPDRTREVLGVFNFPTEGSRQWISIFKQLKARGVKRIDLVVSDALKSIEDAVWKVFKESEVQLCTVHLLRNYMKEVKFKHKKELTEDFKDVFRTDDRRDTKEEVRSRFNSFCDKWGKYYSYFKRQKKNLRIDLYFTYISYHYRIRSMIKTTNWIERLNRDFKRTTRMRGALPNPEATLLLLGAVARDKKVYLRKVPKLDYEQNKFDWEE